MALRCSFRTSTTCPNRQTPTPGCSLMTAHVNALFLTEEDQAILQKVLNKFIMWEDRCNLSFHPVPNCPRELIKENSFLRQYCPCGEALQEVDYTKFLGVTLASDATCKTQINAVTNHASLGLLRWTLKFGADSVKNQAYNSFFKPVLEYACSVWDPHNVKHIKSLEAI